MQHVGEGRRHELDDKIYDLIKEKCGGLDLDELYSATQSFYNALILDFGRHTEIPKVMKDLVEQAKSLLPFSS